MLFFRRIFGSKPILPSEEAFVEFTHAKDSFKTLSMRLINNVVTFPISFAKRVRNTYLLIRNAELREPASKNVCPMRWITTFPSLFFTMKVTTIPSVMKAILRYPRKDPEGFFNDRENAQVFLPLLKDMYPEEEVSVNDFLLTCHKDYVPGYRQPILQFIGPQNIKKHGRELQNVVTETVHFWGEKSREGQINATELSLAFTTAVISRLLLGHPGPFQTYRDIAYAIDYLNKYVMKKTWRHPISKEEKEKYAQSLTIVRQAIEISITTLEKPHLGSLVDALKEEKQLTELQIRTTLFLMYLGGSETTASLLNYLLWQLGQHPEYQEEIIQEIEGKEGDLYEIGTNLKSVDRLFAESIRLFTPVYVIGRQHAHDLMCTIKNKQGDVVFQEKIAKKEGMLCMPTFAARDPLQYNRPDEFNPHRFENPPKTYPWLPFADGKHSCPGQWLAKAEVVVFMTLLTREYEIKSFPEKEFRQKGYMTLKPAEDVFLTLTKRERNSGARSR